MTWHWLSWKPRAVIEAEHRAFLDECSALYAETRPKTAREQLLELHLRRVLEAGRRARQIAVVSHPDIAAAFDQAASDAEVVLTGTQGDRSPGK